MNRRHFLQLSALVVGGTQYGCGSTNGVKMQQHLDSMRKIPALLWLDSNKNEGALASNRFGPTAQARTFVESLLKLGAVQVFVADPREEESRLKLEGGPYADTLIVELPEEKAKRQALFKVFAEEAKREEFASEPDVGQKQVLLWWD